MHTKVERHYDPANWERIYHHLEHHGYILLGEHYCRDVEEFEKLILSWNIAPAIYQFGQAPKIKSSNFVVHKTKYDESDTIPIHQELSYSHNAPRYLFFFCKQPAQFGGEYSLLDCEWFLDNCPKRLLKPYLDKGIRYYKHLNYRGGGGMTWPMLFETNDKKAVERQLTASNISYQWNEDESLSTKHYQKATRKHPTLNRHVWFAQPEIWHVSQFGEKGNFLQQRYSVDHYPTHSSYGNGDEISIRDIEELRNWKKSNALHFRWQANDLLVIDNWRIAYGRDPYGGVREQWMTMGCLST